MKKETKWALVLGIALIIFSILSFILRIFWFKFTHAFPSPFFDSLYRSIVFTIPIGFILIIISVILWKIETKEDKTLAMFCIIILILGICYSIAVPIINSKICPKGGGNLCIQEHNCLECTQQNENLTHNLSISVFIFWIMSFVFSLISFYFIRKDKAKFLWIPILTGTINLLILIIFYGSRIF